MGGGAPVELRLHDAGRYDLARTGPDTWALDVDGERREWAYARDGEVTWVGCEGHAWPVRTSPVSSGQEAHADGDLRAPMPGQVLLIPAAAGQTVRAGDPVVVLESMKMELVLTAPVDGAVTELSVAVGDTVAVDQPLARVEAAD